jgi:hypothetical protein
LKIVEARNALLSLRIFDLELIETLEDLVEVVMNLALGSVINTSLLKLLSNPNH